MNQETLSLIKDINALWDPVYPYLAEHIKELYSRRDGTILEMGPFCGVIFALQEKGIGDAFLIAAFPPQTSSLFHREVKNRKQEKAFKIIETNPSLAGVSESSVDLAIFRGAFFFPFLGEAGLLQIHRVLKPTGIGLVGGGFGKHTPERIIQNIARRSRELNLRLGKKHITEDTVLQSVRATGLEGKMHLITEGGLWMVLKK